MLVAIIILTFSIILHATGVFILYKYRTLYTDKIQHMLLANLSATELILSIFFLFYTMEALPNYKFQVFAYVSGIFILQVSLMLLTLNRFFQVFLNLKYSLYWNLWRTKISLIMTWVVGILIGIILVSKNMTFDQGQVQYCDPLDRVGITIGSYGVIGIRAHRQ